MVRNSGPLVGRVLLAQEARMWYYIYGKYGYGSATRRRLSDAIDGFSNGFSDVDD